MRKYLLAGLITLLPLALTFMIIVFLFDFFTTPFLHLAIPLVYWVQQQASLSLPQDFAIFLSRVFALIFLCLFILLLGAITRWLFVKNLINFTNWVIYKIPFVKTVYKVSRDIFSAIFSSEGKKAFKHPVMVPFPKKPTFCLGFLAGEVAEECQEKVEKRLVSVFMPTAPHPISGFLILVPEEDTHAVDLTNEETFKFLVSCGMITPENKEPHEIL